MADADSTPGKSPAFQFYPKDFVTDERVRLMSMQERGVYITLICLCWTEGTLPADTLLISRLLGIPITAFRRLWPAISPCFRASTDPVRLIHPRLEKERRKQRAYRRKQTENGKRGGRPPNSGKPTANPSLSRPGFRNESSTSAVSDLQSPISTFRSADKDAAPDARSKRPIYSSDRFSVFEWQLDELSKILGAHFEGFRLDEFFDLLSARSRSDGLVIPKSEAWPWLQSQVLAEARKRDLPMAGAAPSARDKAAEHRAQDERILAAIQQDRVPYAGR